MAGRDSHVPASELTLGDLKQAVSFLLAQGPGGPGATDHGALDGLADDDHTQYHTDARGDARYSLLAHDHDDVYSALAHNHDGVYSPLVHDHDADYAPLDHEHSGADITSGTVSIDRLPSALATDVEVAAVVAAHEAASDPHPGYTTAAELTAAIDAHTAAANPHPTYLTQAEGDALYDPLGGGGGAPTTVDYLVGTASGDLSAEIVVGTSPGGELGGTWASPTVDATHSGSSHAGVQAAAEATAAGALATHAAAADPHTGYVLESLFDANTILKADSDNTPAALTMGASTILARLAAGNIVAATPAQLRTLLDVPTTGEAILDALIDAKGDLLVGTAADTVARLVIGGTNGHVLTVDSAEASGMKWAAAGAGSAPAAASVTAGPINVTTTAQIELASLSLTTTAGRKYLINASVRFLKDTGTTTRAMTLRLRRTDAAGTILTESGGASSAIASSPFGAALTHIDTPGAGAPFVWKLYGINFASATISAALISFNVVELA